jgi:hypothetical protein
MTSLLSLPKPALFSLFGALGCLAGALAAEPVLLANRPEPAAPAHPRGPELNAVPGGSMLFPPQVAERLNLAGARPGAIEIALSWNSIDDLDLHCLEPIGSWRSQNHIFFGNKRSPSGGELDVDRNVSPPFSEQPVEHITWSESAAAVGHHAVRVELFKKRTSAGPIPFQIYIKHGDGLTTFESELSGEGEIAEFTFDHSPLHLAPSAPPVRTAGDWLAAIAMVGVWSAFLAGGLGAALTAGQSKVVRRCWPPIKSLGQASGASALAGALAGGASQASFGALGLEGSTLLLAQCAAWALLGAVLGAVISRVVPNLPPTRAALAGGVAGILGGAALVFLSAGQGGTSGRIIGAMLLGMAIGLMVAVAEAFFVEGSLRVVWAPKEESRIGLGARPISIGSAPDCDLRLPAGRYAPLVGTVAITNGRIAFHDRATGAEHPLKGGSRLEFGSIVAIVEAKSRTP